jgi:hypothetical protein
MISFTLTQLKSKAASRPQGYVEDVLKYATVDGEQLTLSDEDHAFLKKKYRPPTVTDMARSLSGSVFRLMKKGYEVVSPEVFESRLAICHTCEFWEPRAFRGTGRCGKCGCSTMAKLKLSTERCPVDKWGFAVEEPKE